MARQRDTQITGTYGSVIFYKSGEDYFIRSKGKTGKQAAVAKQQASILGKASAISARLRAAFKPLLPGSTNRATMYRLNNAMQQWFRTEPGPFEQTAAMNEIPALKGFSFMGGEYGNIFYAAMPVKRKTSGELTIHIPAFDSPNPIAPLPFRGNININIVAASCNITNPAETSSIEKKLDIIYTGDPIPAQELDLGIVPSMGELTVVAVSINKTAVGIVGAMFN